MVKYILRIDDVYRFMDIEVLRRLKELDAPLVLGVTPNWKLKQRNGKNWIKGDIPEKEFIKILHEFKGEIALHGYTHELFEHKNMLNINSFGEFAGLSYLEQFDRLRKGKAYLDRFGFDVKSFIAPAHSFDRNTLKALRDNDFCIVSDGFALYPFKKKGLLFIPQMLWGVRKVRLGIATICIHPDNLKDLSKLKRFIENNKADIVTLKQVYEWYSKIGSLRKLWYSLLNLVFYASYKILKFFVY